MGAWTENRQYTYCNIKVMWNQMSMSLFLTLRVIREVWTPVWIVKDLFSESVPALNVCMPQITRYPYTPMQMHFSTIRKLTFHWLDVNVTGHLIGWWQRQAKTRVRLAFILRKDYCLPELDPLKTRDNSVPLKTCCRLKYCRTGNFRGRKFSRFSTTGNSRAGNFREFLVRGAS